MKRRRTPKSDQDVGVPLSRAAGELLMRALGGAAAEAGEVLRDWLSYKKNILRVRAERLERLAYQTEKTLSSQGVKEVRHVPPKLALPILEEATLEDENALQDLWARLLATAMNPQSPPIKRSYIGILREFEAQDAAVMRFLWDVSRGDDERVSHSRLGDGSFMFAVDELTRFLNIDAQACELALINLDRLGCIMMRVQRSPSGSTMEWVFIHVSALGAALMAACNG